MEKAKVRGKKYKKGIHRIGWSYLPLNEIVEYESKTGGALRPATHIDACTEYGRRFCTKRGKQCMFRWPDGQVYMYDAVQKELGRKKIKPLSGLTMREQTVLEKEATRRAKEAWEMCRQIDISVSEAEEV